MENLPAWQNLVRINLQIQGEQIQIQIKQRVDERFNSAINLLGSSETSARTGAIYTLHELALEEGHLMGALCEFLDTPPHWFLNEHVNRGFVQFAGDIYPPPMPIHARYKSRLCVPKFHLILINYSVKGRILGMHSVKGRVLEVCGVKGRVLEVCGVKGRFLRMHNVKGRIFGMTVIYE
jgi:hypothetical protein